MLRVLKTSIECPGKTIRLLEEPTINIASMKRRRTVSYFLVFLGFLGDCYESSAFVNYCSYDLFCPWISVAPPFLGRWWFIDLRLTTIY